MVSVTREQIETARKIDLFTYLRLHEKRVGEGKCERVPHKNAQQSGDQQRIMVLQSRRLRVVKPIDFFPISS